MPNEDYALSGYLAQLMLEKLRAMLGSAANAVEIRRHKNSDDYYGTLTSGCRFEWPASGILTVYPRGQ